MEVLISIALLSLVLLALYQSVDMLRDSNRQLRGHLLNTKEETRVFRTLYLDILSSDGNMTITKDGFTRLCIEETINSLYALPSAKVCWLVHKEDHTLLRIEGNGYTLPTAYDQRVEVDKLLSNMELFDVYRKNDRVLVVAKEKGKDPVSFMVQGVNTPVIRR